MFSCDIIVFAIFCTFFKSILLISDCNSKLTWDKEERNFCGYQGNTGSCDFVWFWIEKWGGNRETYCAMP